MASDFNQVTITGRLTRDPEVRTTSTDKIVANFSVACNRMKDGQADFIDCVAWDKLGEIVGNNLAKGRRVLVSGRLQVRSYETNDGQKRKATEVLANQVQFLDSKNGGSEQQAKSNEAGGSVMDGFGSNVFPGEEIPF